MTRATFDVLREPWIPVVDQSGTRSELGIAEALALSPNLAGVRDPSPLVEFGIYRLLVAFVLDALHECGLRPTSERDLEDLADAGSLPSNLVNHYSQSCGPVFDLFDPDRPFLQDPTAGGGDKPIAALYPAVPSGTNVHHWHHAHEDEMGTAPAEAARLLTTIAPFMTAGGPGLAPSINGAPGIYALPLGRSLFETLIWNLPLEDGPGDGRVAWRSERTPGGERTRAGMGEALTWRPRRIHLSVPNPESGLVETMRFQAGDSTRFTWTDPNLAYKYDKEDQKPVRMREGRPLWRDAGPLALLTQRDYKSPQGTVSYQRPAVVEQALSLCEGDVTIRIYGMRTDNAKVFEWSSTTLVIPKNLGVSTGLGAWVQRQLDAAEDVAFSLRGSIRSLCPRDAAGNKEGLKRAAERAGGLYWGRLERGFQSFLYEVNNYDESDLNSVEKMAIAADPWRALIRTTALTAFESVAKDFDADSDALKRAVLARGKLLAASMDTSHDRTSKDARQKK